MKKIVAAGALAGVTLIGCDTSARNGADGQVLARYTRGAVTGREVDEELLARPGAQRWAPGEGARHVTGVARELALDRLLITTAVDRGLAAEEDLALVRAEAGREAAAKEFFGRLPAPPALTEGELRALFEERRGELAKPARRLVSHLFLYRRDGAPVEPVLERMYQLRQRVARGESFRELAEEFSESESRHRDGSIGWVEAPDLPPGLAQIIFSLPVGEPSRPVIRAAGVHLFRIEEEQPARTPSFYEARPSLERDLRRRRLNSRLDEATAALPPTTAWRLDSETVERLATEGQWQGIVFRSGDYEVTLQGSLAIAARYGARGAQRIDDALDLLERRERIWAALGAGSGDSTIDRAVARAARRAAAQEAREALLEAAVESRPDELARYWTEQRERFAVPVELEIQRLVVSIPVAGGGSEIMRRLETASTAAADSTKLAALAAEVGGTIEDHGWLGLSGLGALYPGPLLPVLELEPGELAPPLRNGDRLVVLLATGRRERPPPPLHQVRAQVVASFLRGQGERINAELEAELLDAARYRPLPGAIAAWVSAVGGRP